MESGGRYEWAEWKDTQEVCQCKGIILPGWTREKEDPATVM